MTREAPCKLSLPHVLPDTIQPVGRLLGDGPLLALIEAYGGTRLYVPERVAAQDALAALLGLRPAQRLVRDYGRDTITIPLCKRWRIEMLRRDGLTYAAIGRRLGMHEQSVYRALSAGHKGGGRKPDAAAQLRLALD